jgi:hypothetical protein
MTVALLLAAHLSLTALVPAAIGQGPPPWWVGGGLMWPFFLDTQTLLPDGGLREVLTPVLGITAGVCLLLAVAALWRRPIPASWFMPLVVVGAAASIVLQIAWLSGWAILPLALDAVLIWSVLRGRATAVGLRGQSARLS